MAPGLNTTTMTPAAATTTTTSNTKVTLDSLLSQLTLANAPAERSTAASSLATFANSATTTTTNMVEMASKLTALLKDKESREKALEAITAFATASTSLAPAVEPHLIGILSAVLPLTADKNAKTAADTAAKAVVRAANPYAVKAILPILHNSIHASQKWQEKMVALQCIDILVESAPSQLSYRLPEIVPVLSESMWDTKPQVKKTSHATMTKVCTLISNPDIEKFIPALIQCIAEPNEVPETVHMLGATTFVQEVLAPTLSIMVPLLNRGLKERETAIKRKSAVIVDNMCKLVDDPQIVAPFLPQLMPQLISIQESIADPEVRDVIKRAVATLERVGDVKDGKIPDVSTAGDVKTVLAVLKSVLATHKGADEGMFAYIAAIGAQLVDEKNGDGIDWTRIVNPYFLAFLSDADAKAATDTLRKRAASTVTSEESEDDDDDDGEDLCNCDFSLAYGAKILLNRTNLRLKRGRRYGLCGPNGSGKSTLMRAISNGQVEGFPPADELKTVYVEHDIDSSESDLPVLDFVADDERIVVKNRDEVAAQLKEVGFTDAMLQQAIGSLSGGWKMKLALARAMLQKADILLLDEPTNHLDVRNVKWLEDFLMSQENVTSVIVSHDSGFLDRVVQYIIHYERFKLRRYKGNLSQFVKRVPAAQSYYELAASEQDFRFPEPGFLEGVKTKNAKIMKLSNVSYQYPGTPNPQITDVTIQLSLSSRVAIIGPNGAGKSTLVNVLTGELIPGVGEVYQHPNVRLAHLKQHAFQHIDHHLDSTPLDYIIWRYRNGEDRETLDRADKVMTKEDEQGLLKMFKSPEDGTQRRVIAIESRRKLKNSYEYFCQTLKGVDVGLKSEKWLPTLTADNIWLSRNELIDSHSKMVSEQDQKEALAAGNFRPLVRKEIEAHCAQLGLDAELVSHSRIRGLSGGQKVKLVLAACTWLRPHVIVMDEPTNYLDRVS